MSGRRVDRLKAVLRRLQHIVHAPTFDRELEEEISLHIEMRAEELEEGGMGTQ